jgi:hypothetical protein
LTTLRAVSCTFCLDTGRVVPRRPLFLYFNPLQQLATHQRRRWQDPREQQITADGALSKARNC